MNRDSRGNIQQAAPTGRTISTRQNTSTRGAAALPAAAAALQYLDQETRTWTTDDFVAAMETIRDSGLTAVPGILYCGGQGGDQGTRALVNNLYSGTYTNPEHTEYTVNSPENVKALELLKSMVDNQSLNANAGFQASDELQQFANGTAAVTFCWNASNKAQYTSQVTFTPYAMAFPSDDGVPELCGGIWGFGIFDSGDEARIEAAKTFIKFVCDDENQAAESVRLTGFFPVRESLGDVYEGTDQAENMGEFASLMPYLGDYYNVAPNWTEQRQNWFNMLQRREVLTISTGIARLQGEVSSDFGLIMAGAALAAIPIVAVFLMFQKYFTQGITMGAVKG